MQFTKIVELLILELLDQGDGTVEMKRGDLASRAGCAPSQINYVISQKFTPQRGYVITSRRGEGGYIRIQKVQLSINEYLTNCFHMLNFASDLRKIEAIIMGLHDNNIITKCERDLLTAATSSAALRTLPPAVRAGVRIDTLRQMIIALIENK